MSRLVGAAVLPCSSRGNRRASSTVHMSDQYRTKLDNHVGSPGRFFARSLWLAYNESNIMSFLYFVTVNKVSTTKSSESQKPAYSHLLHYDNTRWPCCSFSVLHTRVPWVSMRISNPDPVSGLSGGIRIVCLAFYVILRKLWSLSRPDVPVLDKLLIFNLI